MQAPVTVAILTFNEEKNIRRAIESVAHGDWKPACLLVIDNGSTDNTQFVVEDCRKSIHSFPIFLIGADDNNLGASRALAVSRATTEYIAFLDADCMAPKEWLEKLWRGLCFYDDNYENIAAVGG